LVGSSGTLSNGPLVSPDAGIPRLERHYGWVLVRLGAACPVGTLMSKFERVSGTLVALCPDGEDAGTCRVRVRRFPGIENSSRDWSGAMVLEHLTIVGRHATDLIWDLCHGRTSSWVLRTQDVKPNGGLTRARSVAGFEAMVSEYVRRVREAEDGIHSPTRHLHPWFGALRCKQWVAFMTLHHMVHLPHMKAIRAAVSRTAAAPAR
jgi:hypothetical protein